MSDPIPSVPGAKCCNVAIVFVLDDAATGKTMHRATLEFHDAPYAQAVGLQQEMIELVRRLGEWGKRAARGEHPVPAELLE